MHRIAKTAAIIKSVFAYFFLEFNTVLNKENKPQTEYQKYRFEIDLHAKEFILPRKNYRYIHSFWCTNELLKGRLILYLVAMSLFFIGHSKSLFEVSGRLSQSIKQLTLRYRNVLTNDGDFLTLLS